MSPRQVLAVASVVGGAGYALGLRRWWHSYRQDPTPHAAGASPRLLAAAAVVACLGLAVLLVLG